MAVRSGAWNTFKWVHSRGFKTSHKTILWELFTEEVTYYLTYKRSVWYLARISVWPAGISTFGSWQLAFDSLQEQLGLPSCTGIFISCPLAILSDFSKTSYYLILLLWCHKSWENREKAEIARKYLASSEIWTHDTLISSPVSYHWAPRSKGCAEKNLGWCFSMLGVEKHARSLDIPTILFDPI